MRLTFAACILIFALSGCFNSKSYLAVAQEVLQVSGEKNSQLVAEIRIQLEARGFKADPSFDYRQAGETKTHFWYEGSRGTYAAIDVVSSQCVRFAMLIPADSRYSSAARAEFADIMSGLKPSDSWTIPKDHICLGAP